MRDLAFIIGTNIYLRPLVETDADGDYVKWFNDEEVCQGNSHHVLPHTKEKTQDYIKEILETDEDLILAIVLKSNDKHIGNIGLQSINHIYHSADLSIIIGDKSAWGKGYGMEAASLLVNHGFFSLNLHRISCGTFDTNMAMKKIALSLGMTEEGRRRDAAYKKGRYVDLIEYGLLKNDYELKMRQ